MAAQRRPPDARKRAPRRRPVAVLATLGLALALLAALVVLATGPGYRTGLLSLETAFTMMRAGAYGGIAAAVLSLAGLAQARPGGHRRGFVRALAGLVIGLVVVGLPWSYTRTASRVPPIHDITTDPDNPPQFHAVRPLRADAPNRAEYGGQEVAAQQREAYPDIQPLHLALPPDQAFRRALSTAQAMGWDIVRADQPAGRIEATDETFWFGFKDDVVIRVRGQDGGSRIDVRSTSRVGRSDLGVNAARVRTYLARLEGRPAGV